MNREHSLDGCKASPLIGKSFTFLGGGPPNAGAHFQKRARTCQFFKNGTEEARRPPADSKMIRAFSDPNGFWGLKPRALPLGWYERRLWRQTRLLEVALGLVALFT